MSEPPASALPPRTSGDTLASDPGPPVADAPPNVPFVVPAAPRGVHPGIVAALVLAALAAGFLLGWAAGGARAVAP